MHRSKEKVALRRGLLTILANLFPWFLFFRRQNKKSSRSKCVNAAHVSWFSSSNLALLPVFPRFPQRHPKLTTLMRLHCVDGLVSGSCLIREELSFRKESCQRRLVEILLKTQRSEKSQSVCRLVKLIMVHDFLIETAGEGGCFHDAHCASR